MRTKPFGSSGVAVPVIGQGTWNFPESGARREVAMRAIRRGIELGMTHLDTAEMYGGGRVEELLGETIAGIPREKLFITSKVLPSNADYAGTIAACERSLRRMKLEHLDLYLLHWPGEHDLAETMRALTALVQQGKTRFAGVSNFDAVEMLEAATYLRPVALTCNQLLYHLRERRIERDMVGLARERGVAIVAYTPFGRGRFPLGEAKPEGLLGRIASKHGATPRQVVLAFLTRSENVFTIPKAASVEHVEENAGAANVILDAADVAAIDAAFPIGPAGPLATL